MKAILTNKITKKKKKKKKNLHFKMLRLQDPNVPPSIVGFIIIFDTHFFFCHYFRKREKNIILKILCY